MSDLISRQAIIDAIQKLNIPEDMCVFEIISHIEVAIATLPSVVIRDATSEERESVDNYIKSISTKTGRKFDVPSVENKGEWMLLEECSNSGYYCSRCHKKVVKEGWSETVKKIKFCPNCGADMRGE